MGCGGEWGGEQEEERRKILIEGFHADYTVIAGTRLPDHPAPPPLSPLGPARPEPVLQAWHSGLEFPPKMALHPMVSVEIPMLVAMFSIPNTISGSTPR